jgi:hypothetical protein
MHALKKCWERCKFTRDEESRVETTPPSIGLQRFGSPKPINPVLACISLGVQRIYGSAENPYTPAISFLMLTWTLHKFSMLQRITALDVRAGVPARGMQWISLTMDVIYDVFIVSNMLFTGVIVQVIKPRLESLRPHPQNSHSYPVRRSKTMPQ